MTAFWRTDIDALSFRPVGHLGTCVIHRRALATLLGRSATPDECLALFACDRDLFERAAAEKRLRAGLSPDAHFHLTSRDLRRVGAGRPLALLRERRHDGDGKRRPRS